MSYEEPNVPRPQARKTVLLVEDEAPIALAGKMTLQKHSYTVITASSGEKAIEITRTAPAIDLILMDINLGKRGMDGTEAAEIILREHDIPILFLSSYIQQEIVEKTEKITSYGYVVKDSGETVLLASMKMAFKLHEAHRRLKEHESSLKESLEELQKAEHEIRMSEEQYRSLYISMNESFALHEMVLDAHGDAKDYRILDVNPSFQRITGISRDRAMGTLGSELYGLGSAPYMDIYAKVAATGEPFSFNTYFAALDKHFNISVFSPGKSRFATVTADITENVAAAKAIEESEEKFRLLFEKSADPILMLDGERFVDCNEATLKIMHCKGKDQLINARPSDISPERQPDWRLSAEKADEVIGIALKQGVNHFEWKHRAVDGEEFLVDVSLTVIPIKGKRVMHVLWRDLTDRKLAEKALRESEYRFRSLVDHLPQSIFVKDRSSNYVTCNHRYAQGLGIEPEAIAGRTDYEFHPKDLADKYREDDQTVIVSGKTLSLEEKYVRFGEERWARITKVPYRDQTGDIIGVVGIFEDITEGKRIGQEIRENEERYRRLSEDMPIYVSTFLPDSTLTYVNSALAGMSGMDPEEMIGLRVFDRLSPHDRAVTRERLALLTPENPIETHEQSCITPEGSERFQEWTNRAFFDDSGLVTRYQGVGRDITDRKRAEKALRQTQQELKCILDAVPAMIWQKDTEGRYIMVNQLYCKTVGLSEEAVIGNTDFDLYPDEIASRYMEDDQEILTSQASKHAIEEFHKKPSGDHGWSLTDKMVWYDMDGSVRGTIGFALDITDRKNAEEALKESEGRFRALAECSAVGIYLTDQNGDCIYVNRRWMEAANLTAEEAYGKGWLNGLHPDDRAAIGERWYQSVQSGGMWGFEYRFQDRAGHVTWVYGTAAPLYSTDGTEVGHVGVNVDITDRKEAEDQIKSLLAEKELLLKEVHHRVKNNMATIMSLLSLQSTVLKGNSSAVAALQDSRSRVQSMMVLYDKLYRSSDFRATTTEGYLTALIDEIMSNFPNRGLVTIEKQIDDFSLDAKALSPVGMILNELLTNAMKYAFEKRDKGRVFVSLTREGNHAELIVEDDGIGTPESIGITTSTGFGLQVVGLLTEQLEGTIRVERDKGSRFVLEFDI